MKPLPPWHSTASAATAGARLQIQYFAIGSADARQQPLGFALLLAVERGDEAKRQPGRRLNLERHVGDHVRHHRLIDEAALERPAMRGVMRGLRQRLPHQAGGADREVEPGVVVHLDAGANAVSGLADQMTDGAAEFDLG